MASFSAPPAPRADRPLSRQLDILCNEEILGKDHTLKFVVVTRWRFKVSLVLVWTRSATPPAPPVRAACWPAQTVTCSRERNASSLPGAGPGPTGRSRGGCSSLR